MTDTLEHLAAIYEHDCIEFARNNPTIGRGMPVKVKAPIRGEGVILETWFSDFYYQHCGNVLMADGTLQNGVLSCNMSVIPFCKLALVK